MATAADQPASSSSNMNQNMSQTFQFFSDKDYVRKVIDGLGVLFDAPRSIMNRILFADYDEFINKLRKFRASLLKFVLEAVSKLEGLKENFETEGYRQAIEEQKVQFIKRRLDKIDRNILYDFIDQCRQLIEESLELHRKYGSTRFACEFVLGSSIGFMGYGMIVGACAGLFAPLVAPVSMGIGAGSGAIIGGLIGFVSGLVGLVWKRDKLLAEVNTIRSHLLEIREKLSEILLQLDPTHRKLGKLQGEIKEKVSGESFQSLETFEMYVKKSYDEFIELKTLVLRFDDKNIP